MPCSPDGADAGVMSGVVGLADRFHSTPIIWGAILALLTVRREGEGTWRMQRNGTRIPRIGRIGADAATTRLCAVIRSIGVICILLPRVRRQAGGCCAQLALDGAGGDAPGREREIAGGGQALLPLRLHAVVEVADFAVRILLDRCCWVLLGGGFAQLSLAARARAGLYWVYAQCDAPFPRQFPSRRSAASQRDVLFLTLAADPKGDKR